jgi:ubiquinone/menaquinone biosynthesis C-methylase UbiE
MKMRRPHFIAAQARRAAGPLGRLIAFIMAFETWTANRKAIEALDVRDGNQVLDVGCGPGRSLAALAARAGRGRVVGLDPSPLMADVARRRNRLAASSGRIEVTVGEIERLPFPDGTFDRVLCVHVLYFWTDLHVALHELRRVLRVGARLSLLFRSKADARAVQSFPPDVYRFATRPELVAALVASGFIVCSGDSESEPVLLVAEARP